MKKNVLIQRLSSMEDNTFKFVDLPAKEVKSILKSQKELINYTVNDYGDWSIVVKDKTDAVN
jgi:hypothetical protein